MLKITKIKSLFALMTLVLLGYIAVPPTVDPEPAELSQSFSQESDLIVRSASEVVMIDDSQQPNFSIDRFPLAFADSSISEELESQIMTDVEEFLGSRKIERQSISGGPIVELDDVSLRVTAILNYGSTSGQDLYQTPLLLKESGIDSGYRYLIEIEQQEQLYLSDDILELYKEQTALRELNPQVYEALDVFVAGMNNLENTLIDLQGYNAIFDRNAALEASTLPNVQEVIDSAIRYYFGKYDRVSMLNVGSSERVLGENAVRYPNIDYIASVGFISATPGNPGYSSKTEFYLAYESDQWKIWTGWFRE